LAHPAKPFSSDSRGVVLRPLEDGWAFAFNFDVPSGVILLRGRTLQRLEELRSRLGGIPELENSSCEEDRQLSEKRLIKLRSEPELYLAPQSEARSFNVWLHIINGCNFSCFYCYIPHLKAGLSRSAIQQHVMPDTVAIQAADSLLGYCRRNNISHLHIKFAGGEPTLAIDAIKKFCAHVSLAGDVRVSFGIISNGSFSADDLVPLLKCYPFSVSFSVDGYRETHDQIRFTGRGENRRGSWSDVEKNISRVSDLGIRPYLLYTVTRKNAESLRQFASWAHSQKLGFRLSLVRMSELPVQADYDSILPNVCDLYEHLGKTMPASLDFERDARFAEWNLKRKKISACGSCKNYIALTETGDIKSCQMADKSAWNITRNPIDEAIKGFKQDDKLRHIASPEEKSGPCTRCEYFHVCTGGCPQHTIAVTKTSDLPSPWCGVFGNLLPTYIEARARHMLRQLRSAHTKSIATTLTSEYGRA
jgi:uncharacterized protein